jgi:DNA-binding winged helix-turn-helix (wHTH) protein
LDLDTRRLFGPDGAEVPLTPMEFDLLRTFAEHPNKVLAHDRLLDLAHDRGMEPFDRSVDSRVKRLRKKIEEDPALPRVIKTIHGAGYLFAPIGDSAASRRKGRRTSPEPRRLLHPRVWPRLEGDAGAQANIAKVAYMRPSLDDGG